MGETRYFMRWDCSTRGCFNVKMRPKFAEFAGCFPGRIGMSDVDAICEINSRFLMLEWKSVVGELPTGQRILFQRLTTAAPLDVIVVAGDAETMEVDAIQIIRNGRIGKWSECDLESLKKRMSNWAAYAQRKAS